MTKLIMMVSLAAALTAGCKKKATDETPATPGSGQAMTPDDKLGSATPGSGSAAVAVGSGSAGSGSAVAVAKPLTSEELLKTFETCWGYYSDSKWDDYKTCYTADAVAESPGLGSPPDTGAQAIVDGAKLIHSAMPDQKSDIQFELLNGHTLVSAVLLTGTQSAALKMPGMPDLAATNKKAGFYFSQVIELDDAGKVKHEWRFFDAATMLGQLAPNKAMPVRAAVDKLMGPKEVVIAKDDDKEKANLAAFAKLTDAYNKHDLKALDVVLDDKVMWSEVAEPKDTTKKEMLGMLPKMWKSFSDLKFTPSKTWAAGDYVAAVEMFDGTNDGDGEHMKKTGKKVSLPFLAVHKFENGKNTMTWIIYQNFGFMAQLGMMPAAPAPGAGSGSGSGSAKQ